jgi:hypothetical protein
MKCQAELLRVVTTLCAPRRLSRLLHRGEQQCDQNRDDSDYDQQFDEGETFAVDTRHD